MIRNILQRIKESKGGFTLVELMVTMVLVGILLGASAAGIFYYQKWSVWQRQEHYARTLWGCGRFLGPELSNSKTASILHRTQTP